MMTKDEERNLLAKIEKLLNTAGPDGYVAAAFRGCVDLAKSNIENDFCQSLEENLRLTEEDASRNYMKLCEAYEKLTDEKADLMETINAQQEEYSKTTDRLQKALQDLSAERAAAENYRKQLEDERREHAVNISRMRQQYSDVSTHLQERGKEIESVKNK